MQFTRITNQILLGAVAFSVSFCVTLVVNRDIKQAFFTGLITVPATYSSTLIINRRGVNQAKRLIDSLQEQILELEEYKIDLNQFLGEALVEEQEVEASINALQSKLDHLRTKLSEGYNHRKQRNWELYILQNQKQQQEAEIYSLENQINNLENQFEKLTKDFNQLESSKQLEIQKIESNVDLLKLQENQLKEKIQEKENERTTIEQELVTFNTQKNKLLEEKRTIQANINLLQVELRQLQIQVIEKQNEKKAIEQGLSHFEEQRRQLVEGLHNLKVQTTPSLPTLPQDRIPELSDEWTEFRLQLTDYEFLVLKAIAEQDNPSVAIKKIAQEYLTMPEVLIDSINERAMETIGDLIIDSGLSSAPLIRDEYLTAVKKLIKS